MAPRRASVMFTTLLLAPLAVLSAPTIIEKRQPLLGFAGTEPAALAPSPVDFAPTVPTHLPSPRALADDAEVEAGIFEIKRDPSMKFRREAEIHVDSLNRRLRQKRALGEQDESEVDLESRASSNCLAAGSDQNAMTNAFLAGGANFRLALCPGVTYSLTDVVYFTAAGQELYTFGYPLDNSRATLLVTGVNQSVAVYGGCGDCNKVAIRNVQINGQRPALGHLDSGAALIEMGGSVSGQVVSGSHLWEPRGWSAFHIAEGYELSCTGTTIVDNQVGPSGNSPNSAYQFHRVMQEYAKLRTNPDILKRDGAIQAPGQWADGISLSCANSVVRGNVITDATDGMIVIFGSPGSQIIDNTIISNQRVALGGINMVDKWPWGGGFDGVVVSNNNLVTQASMIKVGIAMGPMVWGSYNGSDGRTWGGNVHSNTFLSVNGYFGFGIATAGHFDATVGLNSFAGSRYNYATSYACFPQWMPPPAGPMVRDPTTSNGTFVAGDVLATIVIPICIMPCEYSTAGCSWGPANSVINGVAAVQAATATAASTEASMSAEAPQVANNQQTKTSTKNAKTTSTKSPKAVKTTSTKPKVQAAKATKAAAATKSETYYLVQREAEERGTDKVEKRDEAALFVDDRPPYTFDSDEALKKDTSEYALADAPFEPVVVKRDLNASDNHFLLPGYGRNVYQKDSLADEFLAPLES